MDDFNRIELLGKACALGSALLWAVAAVLWNRLGRHLSALSMNLGKGLVALLLLGAIALFVGAQRVDLSSLLWLSASGVLGISLGDTGYFISLIKLGPRRSLLLTALIPVFAAGLATLLLGERLPLLGWLGGVLCVAGVAWVIRERTPLSGAAAEDARSQRAGVYWGLFAALCCALSAILAKVGVRETPALEATLIRIAAGTIGLLFYLLLRGNLRRTVAPLRTPRLLAGLALTAFFGTFLGIWLSLAALRLTSATSATLLNSTSPIFILPLAALLLRERISTRAIIGALLAVAGVGLLLASSS